jgi:cell wall-associated NlpC family hydrolase
VVAGAALWFVRWLASPPELLPEPEQEAEPKPARDDWEFPQPKLAPVQLKRMSRRFATTLAFTAIFFAGAALAAGAGNEVAKLSSDSAAVAAPAAQATTTTEASDATATTADATATDPAPAPTDAAPTSPDPTTPPPSAPPAPAPAPAPDPAPTDQSQAQPDGSPDSTPAPADATPPPATTTDATAADATPPSSTDPTTTDATATDPTDTPQPVPPADQPAVDTPASAVTSADPVSTSTAAPKPRPATRPKRHTLLHKQTTTRAHTQTRHLDNLPLVVPYHALVFNPQAWLNDNPGTPTGQAAVAIAMNYLGVPYRWGGAVPATGFDCSGLVRFVYAQLGINLVHYAASQFAAFPKLDPAQLAPGDLVFFEPKADGPGHVAMYIGHDEMIEAPHTGAVVRISSFSGAAAAMGFLGAVRPYAAPAPSLVLMSQVEWGPAPSLFRVQ